MQDSQVPEVGPRESHLGKSAAAAAGRRVLFIAERKVYAVSKGGRAVWKRD